MAGISYEFIYILGTLLSMISYEIFNRIRIPHDIPPIYNSNHLALILISKGVLTA